MNRNTLSLLTATALAAGFSTAGFAEYGGKAEGKSEQTEIKADAKADGKSDAAKAVSDATITAKVKSKLLADRSTQGLKINVDTQGGVVTLTGNVQSDAEKDAAEQIAKGTDNVKDVRNELKVGKS